ncbi:MAG UNVERIFIED_CONTAM: hypothetical protein LVR18_40500 [Planctomycetaceae bacterium]
MAAVCVARFQPRRLRVRQEQTASGATSSSGAAETMHPFLGWVHNPQLAVPETIDGRSATTNALGFRDNAPSVRKRSSNELIIGITGGSVAWRFSWEAESRLRELLAGVPELAARQLHIVRLALPGYKQPQQLFSLSYVLALGGEFDAIINLDGFNDGVLAVLENARQGTSIAYPRSWHAAIAGDDRSASVGRSLATAESSCGPPGTCPGRNRFAPAFLRAVPADLAGPRRIRPATAAGPGGVG